MDNTRVWVQTMLTTTPSRWLVLTGSMPPELLVFRPTAKDWSAVECLQHMIDVEKVFQYRLTCFLEGKPFQGYNPDVEGTRIGDQSPTSLALEFESLREQSLQSLEKLHSTDLERRVRHAELGPVTLGEMVNQWAAHDLNHTIQAERALMQPFIDSCGPWSVYFVDHVVHER